MALLDDIAKDVTPTGLAVSVGTLLLTPVLLPAVSRVLRPVAKGVLSTGIQLYRQAAEPVSRTVSGLVTEAQLELASAKAAAGAPAAAAAEEAAKPHRRAHKGEHAPEHPQTADATGGPL